MIFLPMSVLYIDLTLHHFPRDVHASWHQILAWPVLCGREKAARHLSIVIPALKV